MVIIRYGSKIRYISAQQARENFSSLIKAAVSENIVYFICKRGKIAAIIGSPDPIMIPLYRQNYLRWRREQKAARKPVACNPTT